MTRNVMAVPLLNYMEMLLPSSMRQSGRSSLRTQSALKLAMITLCLIFSSGTATLELSWGISNQ